MKNSYFCRWIRPNVKIYSNPYNFISDLTEFNHHIEDRIRQIKAGSISKEKSVSLSSTSPLKSTTSLPPAPSTETVSFYCSHCSTLFCESIVNEMNCSADSFPCYFSSHYLKSCQESATFYKVPSTFLNQFSLWTSSPLSIFTLDTTETFSLVPLSSPFVYYDQVHSLLYIPTITMNNLDIRY